jgi:signal transduction histidine kinase
MSAVEAARATFNELSESVNGQTAEKLQMLREQFEAALEEKAADGLAESAHFVSVVAHELRTPMTSMRGYSDMMAKGVTGELTDMQAQFIDIIRNNVVHMIELVANVNDMSKLRAGKLRLDSKMTTFSQLVIVPQKQMNPLAEEKGIKLGWDVPSGLPILKVDGARISQAIINLIRNAIQYTPEGGEVSVSAEKTEDGRLKVTVSDTGIGMSAEEVAQLGELFFRADREIVQAQKGHGLGYPIAKGLIEAHGGEVHVEAGEGTGTAVSFFLPPMS